MLIRFVSLCLLLLLTACSQMASRPQLSDSGADQAPLPDELTELYNAGLQLMSEQQFEQAETHWRGITDRWQEYPGVWVNHALASYRLSRFDEALKSLERSQQINAEFCPAFKVMALLQRATGQFAAAEQNYLQAASCDPQDAMIPYNLGILYDLYLQDLTRALVQYQRAKELLNTEDEKLSVWIADLQRRQTAQVAGEG